MEHVYFVLFNFIILGVILFLDKKNIKKYAILWSAALIASFIFENLTIYLGFWYYHSEPIILYFSFYTWILYIPYISFCYFIVNFLVSKK